MKIQYITLVLLACIFYSCKDDERGQYALDSVPPGEVRSAEVKNIAGGAIISYVIPSDEDLLYVKAIYTLDDGTVMEQKASSYASSLKIEGIGKSREVEVTLIAGDRSKNESKPIFIKAHPLDAPIYSVLESVNAEDDFGGIRLSWKNPDEADVVLSVVTFNDEGEFTETENFYTNSKQGRGNIRGYEPVERVFGIYLRDRWGNLTDTLKGNYTPLFEEEVEGTFARWNPTGIPYSHYAAAYAIEKMWDGDISTFYLVQTGGYPYSFSFDLGQTVKLSRIKQWQRQDILYTSQNVNRFELWGSTTPEVSDDFAGWMKIGDFTATKPSGRPLGEKTAEDIDFAVAGEDFNVDPNAPAIRYIRYVMKGTWSGDANAAIADLKFFGSIQKTD